MSGGEPLPAGFTVVLHLLEEPCVLVPKAIVFAFGAFQLDRGVAQLILSVTTGFGRAFEAFDVVRRCSQPLALPVQLFISPGIPLDRISHLLDLLPWLAGI